MTAKSKTPRTRARKPDQRGSSKPAPARKKAPQGATKAFDTLAHTLVTQPAPARGKRVRKGSPTVVKERPAFVARLIDATKAIHVILPDERPRKAPGLPAHTHAVLTSLGMLTKARAPIRESSLATMFGPVAIRHHVAEGNIERVSGNKVRLTVAGLAKFEARATSPGFDTALAQAYVDVFVDGKVAPVLNLKPTQVYQVGISL